MANPDSINQIYFRRASAQKLLESMEIRPVEIPEGKIVFSLRDEVNGNINNVFWGVDIRKPSHRQWEAFKKRLHETTTALNRKSMEALGMRNGLMWYQKKICEIDRKLRENPVNRKSVLAWHIMCGSTPTFESSPLLDLPEPHSIQDVLEDMHVELEDKEKCLDYIKKDSF